MKAIYKDVTPLMYMIDRGLKSNETNATERQVLQEMAEILVSYMPVEKVQKIVYGSWKKSDGTGLRYCSNCNAVGNPKWKYCCNCGAKMKR